MILGNFAKDQILEINSRLNSIFPNVPIVLLLSSEDYLEDAVELHKKTLIRVIALGDLPQISQLLINLAQPASKSHEFLGKARVLSLVNIKGGVGTTTIASSLATYYSESNISSLLVDLNHSNQNLSAFYDYSIEGKSALEQAFKITVPELKHLKPCIEDITNNDGKTISIIGAPKTFQESYQLHSATLPVNEQKLFVD